MKISGRVFAGDKPFGSVLLLLFKQSHGFWCASTSPNGRTGAYELHFNDEPGDYILFAISTQFRVCQREVVLQNRETEMTLDIQLEPLHPPESITVGQPPEPTSSRLVRCLKCGGTAPLEWLKSRRQEQIHIPDWAQAQVLEGSKRTVEWMHVHHTAPDSYWPTEIIPNPKDFKKEAAEEMYTLIVKLQEYLEQKKIWPLLYDETTRTATALGSVINSVLAKARGESPDAK